MELEARLGALDTAVLKAIRSAKGVRIDYLAVWRTVIDAPSARAFGAETTNSITSTNSA